jgi:filamentous hemagglutinin family protein
MAPHIRRGVFAASTALIALASLPADAGPSGGTVVGGSAAIQGQGTGSVTINQSSQSAIINWATFNIGKGETTTFNQPNSSSMSLNRVIGGLGPSFLDGNLTANGRVFIVNGDGVLIGRNASVNTAGFLATTSDIRNSDFMAGKYNFNIPGRPDASIANLGSITANSGGFAALVAPGVRNSGTITATLGTVSLAAGNAFTLDFYGDRLITLAVNDQIAGAVKDVQTGETLKSLVHNTGKLSANGGRVQLTAAAARAVVDSVINNKGVIEANSIGTRNGTIVLSAATGARKPAGAPAQTIKLAGQISAAGKNKGTKGGTVVVTGENIVLSGATIDASGDAGGGKVLIGGDTGGGKPSAAALELAKLESFVIPTATTVSVDAASVINTSATGSGNGGKAVVWSDQQTTFAGTILAQGGATGGNGGFVETSGHTLDFTGGRVNTSAPMGKTGNWLLDPTDLTIDASAASTISSNLTSTNIAVQTNADGTTSGPGNTGAGPGDIIVSSDISWTGNNTLTLSAYHDIRVNEVTISNTGAGGLILRADNAGTGVGTVRFLGGQVDFRNSTGMVSIYYNPSGNDNTTVNAASYTTPTDFSSNVTGGQLAAYMLVNTVFDLQNVQNNLGGTYALGRNIDASATASWNGGSGFASIGGKVNTILVGQCIEFQACYHATASWSTSLTGAALKSLGTEAILGADQTSQFVIRLGVTTMAFSTPSGQVTEQLPQFSGGTHVDPCNACENGTVGTFSIPKNATSATISGTFGNSVVSSSAGVNVLLTSSGPPGFSGTFNGLGHTIDGLAITSNGPSLGLFAYIGAGGMVKNLNLTNVTIVGTGASQQIGALAGKNDGLVSNVSVTGAVRGGGGLSSIGAMVGYNTGAIQNSFAGVTVTASIASDLAGIANIGGLAGYNGGSITSTHAAGAVSVSIAGEDQSVGAYVGGLVGFNAGSIQNTYAIGAVAGGGKSTVGGLVGFLAGSTLCNCDVQPPGGTIQTSWASGAVAGGSQSTTGGLVGGTSWTQQALPQNVVNSYWDILTTNQQSSAGGSGLSSSSPFMQASYQGFDFGSTWFMIDGQTRPFLRSEWSTTITNSHQLQLVSMQPGASYTLANDVSLGSDLQNRSSMWSSAGFVPIGNVSFGGFTGTFDGQNHTIDGLAIAPTDPNVNNIGLFATIYGSVSNLALSNVSITANPNIGLPGQFVGTLAGQNAGTVSNVSATGIVNGMPNGVSLAGVVAGGLVGENGVFFNNNQTGTPGAITQSFANVAVTVGDSVVCHGLDCNGGQNSAGGLVGFNSPGSTITDSQAFGTISAGVFGNAGGLVAQNFGTVAGSTTPSQTSSCTQGAAYSCATGAVSVGSLGTGGGLIGFNDGIVGNVFATGAVTGAAGSPSDKQGNQNLTELGGLVGTNQGVIGLAFATGNVGTPVAYLEAGGLVANNSGSILQSFASGNVVAGDNSNAGGLSGSNGPRNNGCDGCLVGDGDINVATIASSFATGNVSVGAVSTAGGLSGTGDGTFSLTSASGNVTGGANGVLGGLVGRMGVGNSPSLVSVSFATGAVGSTGPNSSVGGLVGANGGTIVGSNASGPVTGTSQSFLGGLVGVNVGWIKESTATGLVTGTGAQNYAGGVAGLNFGTIGPTTSSGNVSSGANSVVGGLLGANGAFSNFSSGLVPAFTFPVGTISTDSVATGTASGGSGSVVGPQVGLNYPITGVPAFPSLVNTCTDSLCTILATGVLTDPNPPPPPIIDSGAPVQPFPEAQYIQSLTANATLASVNLSEVVNTQALNRPPSRPPGPGAGPGPGPGGLPPQFGARFFVPPLPGVAHADNEVVLQIPNNIPPAQLQAMMSRLGLTVLGSQGLSLLGVTSYRVHIGNGNSVASVIQALAGFQIVAGAQANYIYDLAQDLAEDPALAGRTQGEGDAAQYALGRLGVIDIHRLLKGTNIAVAVIDSQIDVQHPDLDGVIAGEYDAVGAADQPHAHGTGMAGAIAAHRRLMGIAPAVRLYAIHAFSSGAASSESTTFNILKGLDWAASKGVSVINMSFAGPRDPSMERALKAAHDKGIVLIAAAGNAGPKSPPLYPGADPNVIAVTATDVNDKLFAGANRGRYIAVAAPGVDILVPAPEGMYQLTTGTSVAAAEVAGVAALLLERNPNLSPDDVRKILTSSAHRLGGKDRDDDFGSGLVDLSKAVAAAQEYSTTMTSSVKPAGEDRKRGR